jgi:purine-binding chemotaxis protein CheW
LTAVPGERLVGAFRGRDDQDVTRILDIKGLLSSAFVGRTRPQRKAHPIGAAAKAIDSDVADSNQRLVTFDVAGQEFALSLDVVREIVTAPESLAVMPRSEALVLGVANHRDGLLPLFSLRGLLGLPPSAGPEGRQKVIVTIVGGVLAGLVADRMRAVLSADPALIEAIPSVLAARTGGETRIKAIYRGEAGRRLISILDPERLFREDIMQRLGEARGPGQTMASAGGKARGEERRFLLFRLGEDEFGLPIEAIDEVARVPDQITRVPKTPRFLEGVINLRGEVLPVIDQRRRFDLPKLDDGARRLLIVVRSQKYRAGLIVDDVSEVLRSSADAIAPAPDLTGDITRLVNGVINLADAGRMILILDPDALLSKTERGLLDALGGVDDHGLELDEVKNG